MPDKPMKFCARQTSCRDAYTVGAPGTVKIAHDSAPVDEKIVNEILTMLYVKLPDEDYAKVAELLDTLMDKAEDLNPTKAMAADGFSAEIRRSLRHARRNTVLGYDARPAGLAADAATIKSVFPSYGRLGDGASIGFVRPMPPKPSRTMTAAEKAEAKAMFPNMKLD